MNFNNVLSKVVRLQGVCVCVYFLTVKKDSKLSSRHTCISSVSCLLLS